MAKFDPKTGERLDPQEGTAPAKPPPKTPKPAKDTSAAAKPQKDK